MDLGVNIEVSWVEIEGWLTIDYKHNEYGYKNEFYGKNNPEIFKMTKFLYKLGANSEVCIAQRV